MFNSLKSILFLYLIFFFHYVVFSGAVPYQINRDSCFLVDRKWHLLSNVIYNNAKSFSEGLCAVKKDGKWGFVNNKGQEVIQFLYADTKSFSEGLCAVKKDGKWGFISRNGKEMTSFKYEKTGDFKNGRCSILIFKNEREHLWGFIDKNFKFIITPKFVRTRCFSGDNSCAVSNGRTWTFIDKEGKTLISNKFIDAYSFSNSLALVKNSHGYGFIDKQGAYKIKLTYGPVVKNKHNRFYSNMNFAEPFSEGIAVVVKNGKYGYIMPSGKYLFEPQFDHAWSFKNGFGLIEKDKKYGYVKKDGTYLKKTQYIAAHRFCSDGWAYVVQSDGLERAFLNRNGEINFMPPNVAIKMYYIIKDSRSGTVGSPH